jgi:hypothetical protein
MYFLEVVGIGLVVFVQRHHPVDDLRPVFESIGVADEKIVFIEDAEHPMLEFLDEEQSRPFEQVEHYF